MKLRQMLERQIEDAYRAADGLIALVDEDRLTWKPEGGDNWMTTGQLLRHLGEACGAVMKGFVTGDWSMLGGDDGSGSGDQPDPPPEMPAAEGVTQAREALAADKALAIAMLASVDDEALESRESVAPWDPAPRTLGYSLFECIEHLVSHKSQLFYYLKLQGKPVNTWTLWGMTPPPGDG